MDVQSGPSAHRLARIANVVRERLGRRRGAELQEAHRQMGTLMAELDRLRQADRLLKLAGERAWTGAATRLAERAARVVAQVPYELEAARRLLEKATRPQRLPKVREVVAEIRQAEAEFGDVGYDRSRQVLSVVTGPVELEGLYLGPFTIELRLADLAESAVESAYRVVAQDPHPPATNDSVTHPHVNHDRLCAGDAFPAIAAALESGRLCDFFLLVRGVLDNYNPDSPFVRLEDWDGRPCHDCGYVADEDDRYGCEDCGEDLCSECIDNCARCEGYYCRGCLQSCPVCEEPVCNGCIRVCSDCGQKCCTGCRVEERCPSCRERECAGCGEAFDPEELVACPSCEADLCADCGHGGRVCPSCEDTEATDDPEGQEGDEEEAGGAAGRPGPAVHADQLGQAVVPGPPG